MMTFMMALSHSDDLLCVALQAAPVVKFSGKELAPAFCSGTAVCFSATAGDTTGFTHGQPAQAKSLASRISGTR